MKVSIKHPELGPQITRLESSAAAAATSSTVENNDGFATNDYTVWGGLGEEQTEIVKLTGVTSNQTLNHTTGPVFAHGARTQVAQVKYNQIQIHTASSEDGTYTLLTTVDITPDQPTTVYDDTTGTTATWYKIKYYNSTTAAASSFSVPVQGTGYTEDSLRSMVEEVLVEFNDEGGKDLKEAQVKRYLKAGVKRLTKLILQFYPDYLRAYTTVTPGGTGADSLPDRFLGLIRVDINYSGTSATNAVKATYDSEGYGEPDTDWSQSFPFVSIRGSSLITRPTLSASGMIFMWYWQYASEMSDDNDEHGLPYGARDVLVAFALYKAWLSKDKDIASGYKALFNDLKDEYLDFIAQPRQTMDSGYVEVVFGSEDYE